MKKIKWLVSGLLLLLLPTIVHAWSEDILSHFQVYMTAEEEYNSNIDLTTNRLKRNDFITTVSPGLKFSTLPKSPVTGEFTRTPTAEDRFGFDLDFRAGFVFYAKEHDDNYISLNGNLNAWYAFTRNFTFRVRDYLIRSDEIRESDYSATALPGQDLLSRMNIREPYFRNVFEPSIEYRFGRENSIVLNYRNNIYDIKSSTAEDSRENYFNPRLTYWFNIRHGVYLEYGFTLADLENSPDWKGHMATGRYMYRFNPQTSIFVEYTQLWRNFDNPSVGENPSIDYVVYRPSIGIEHAFSPTLSARVQGGYYWMDPHREGSWVFDRDSSSWIWISLAKSSDGPFFDVLLTKRAQKTTYTLSLQGGYTEDFFTSENLGFAQYYRALGRVTHQLLQRMTVGFFGSYEWAKYPGTVIEDKTPKDNIWAIGADASYQILKWLRVSLDASHRENRSNISDRDYSEYRGILRITATY
jgi:predicted porin